MTRLTQSETEHAIANESEAFAQAVRADALDRQVPGCPDWTLRDLTWHLGNVQRFWTDIVRAGVDEPPEFAEEPPGPTDAVELAAWMRESSRLLLDALRATPYDTPAWAWWSGDHTVGAVARHQVQEAAVHRWDAQSVRGTPDPIPQPAADDAVDEFVGIRRAQAGSAPVLGVATDSGSTFPLTDGAPKATVSATASELLLLFYGRLPIDAVAVEGDRSVLAEFIQPFE